MNVVITLSIPYSLAGKLRAQYEALSADYRVVMGFPDFLRALLEQAHEAKLPSTKLFQLFQLHGTKRGRPKHVID